MIHDLRRRGMGISAIARHTGLDRKTVRKYLEQGMQGPPVRTPAAPAAAARAYEDYLRQRAKCEGLSGRRLMRDIVERGYAGGYTAVTDFLREVRPTGRTGFERRFETPPGQQAQVHFAHFKAVFDDEPDRVRTVWLFSLVLAHSRWLWGRFCTGQDLQTVLRCHIAAFEAMGGVPAEILYDRMKTAVVGEDADGAVTYNLSLVALLGHYGAVPRACRPYRAKTKGKVERPFRYVRQDFFLARGFRDLDDLNRQFEHWRTTLANPRTHATTGRVVDEAFAKERPHLATLPALPYSAPLSVERRISRDAWCPSPATSTASPTPPGGASSRSRTTPARCASSRTAHDPHLQPRLRRVGRAVRRRRRRHRPARPPPPPRRRHPNRGRQLPAPRTHGPDPRTRPRQRPHRAPRHRQSGAAGRPKTSRSPPMRR